MKKQLYYHYDSEADVLYFSQGKPSAKSLTQETGDDIILRLDPKTREATGFTILNFTKRARGKTSALSLPLSIQLSPVK